MLAPNIPEYMQESIKNEIPEQGKRTVQEAHRKLLLEFSICYRK